MSSFVAIAMKFFLLCSKSKSASLVIGHISKNCKGKPRCIFCGGDVHESMVPCPRKNDTSQCINCQGGHLASSHECSTTVRHKMVLFFVASENIPFIDARRKILQGTSVPKDIIYDFNNFPMLNSRKSSNDNNNSYYSDNQPTHLHHRFTVLNSSNTNDETTEDISASRLSPNGFHKVKKSSFSHVTSSPNEKFVSRSHIHTHKNDKFNSHINLLNSPNVRTPNMSSNKVGYNSNSIIDPCSEISNSPPTNHNHEANYNRISDLLPSFISELINFTSIINKIDLASLNNSILLLTKNVEYICNLARTANPPFDSSSARYPSSNNNNA